MTDPVSALREALGATMGVPWCDWPVHAIADTTVEHLPAVLDRLERAEAALNHISLMGAVNYVGFDPNVVASKAAAIAKRARGDT